jgi:CheY-like chemotaxis protein
VDRGTFRQEVEEALLHLRDVVRLRVMDLAIVLVGEVPVHERGWALSRYLLEAVNRLRPDADDVNWWPRRRHDLLNLRYVNGLSVDDAAKRLAVSRRHFYRQVRRALDEFTDYLWAETTDEEADETLITQATPAEALGLVDLELLRRESALLLQSDRDSSIGQLVESVLVLLDPVLARRSVSFERRIPPSLPSVSVSPSILKQILLGLLGEMLSNERTSAISLTVRGLNHGVCVTVRAQRRSQQGHEEPVCDAEALQAKGYAQLARMQGVGLELTEASEDVIAYNLSLPTAGPKTVLVVDDNEEVCLLFRRYLASGGYKALVATNGTEAISLAKSHDLHAITLDLMMNSGDGWDVLQTLTHDPQTCHLPIIICSVLDQGELACMLGAAAFLEKPVLRGSLLETLAALNEADRGSAADHAAAR